MKNKRSPLKDKPLRNAGQSLNEEINRLIDEEAMMYVMAPLFLIMLAIWEWYRWHYNIPPSPVVITIMAIGAALFSVYKLITLKKKLRMLRQGRDGELVVGQYLEHFRQAGMKVFHDVVGENFNIDHVIVSTNGVFLIETKTYSKPMKGETKVVFDGQKIFINGRHHNDEILVQVEAGSKWLEGLIEELTAKKYSVKPVVVFPGWFVEMTNKFASNTWVLNPKGLKSFIPRTKESLTKEDVMLISNHLTRYIRSTQS